MMSLFPVCILALVAIASAVMVVFSRQAVHSALNLTVNLLSVALLYLGLGMGFLGMSQLLIYAGAVMVVFLFAVTVLAPDEEHDLHTFTGYLGGGVVAACLLLAPFGFAALTVRQTLSYNHPAGTIQPFAMQLFYKYVFPFEATAFLLLVALIGAVLLGHRRLKSLGIPSQPPRVVPTEEVARA